MSDSSVFQAWNLLHESILMRPLFPIPFVNFYFILWKIVSRFLLQLLFSNTWTLWYSFFKKCSNINEGENDSIYRRMCIRYIRWWRVLKALIRLFNRVTDSKAIALCKLVECTYSSFMQVKNVASFLIFVIVTNSWCFTPFKFTFSQYDTPEELKWRLHFLMICIKSKDFFIFWEYLWSRLFFKYRLSNAKYFFIKSLFF